MTNYADDNKDVKQNPEETVDESGKKGGQTSQNKEEKGSEKDLGMEDEIRDD